MPNSFLLIEFPKVVDERGSLSFVESFTHVPFEIKRIFYLYDFDTQKTRGDHAHKELHQVLIAVHGGFEVVIDNGVERKTINLSEPNIGLLAPPMHWLKIKSLSNDAVCLVLASDYFDENDYISNYQDFLMELIK